MKKLLYKLSGLTGARMAGALAAFGSTLLVGRYFGTDALANFAIWMSVAGILSVILPVGLQSLAPVVFSKAAKAGELEAASSLLWSGRISILIGAFLVSAAGISWGLMNQASPNDLHIQIFISMALIAPLMALTQLNAGALNGLQKHVSGQLPDTLLRPLIFLSLLLISVFSSSISSAYWILGALALSLTVAVSIQSIALSRNMRSLPANQTSEKDETNWRKRSFSWLSISLLWDYHIEILMLVVATFATPAEVAVLYVCFKIRVLLGFGIKTIYQVLQPPIFSADPKKEAGLIRSAVAKINALSVCYTIPALIGVSFLGSEFLKLFDPTMAQYGAVLLTVCSVMVARAALGPAISLLAANEKQGTIAKTLFVGLLISIAGSVILYPMFGILGVAISYTLSSAVSALSMRFTAKHLFGIETGIWALFSHIKARHLSRATQMNPGSC